LIEAPKVSQLSTKNDLENINRLDEEACASQKKKSCSFFATTEHIFERFKQKSNQN
jgi:hypothetical protein